MNNRVISQKSSQFRLAAFGTIALLVFFIIMIQWYETVRELDLLAAEDGELKFILPKTGGEDLKGASGSIPSI